MITILYEPFSEKRREVRRCWEQQHLIPDWLDYLYLMTGRKEDKEGNPIHQRTLEIGLIFQHKKHTLEVCKAVEHCCKNCVAVGKMELCKKLPCCMGSIYYRKLNNFEIRKLNKKLCKKNTTTPSNNPKT